MYPPTHPPRDVSVHRSRRVRGHQRDLHLTPAVCPVRPPTPSACARSPPAQIDFGSVPYRDPPRQIALKWQNGGRDLRRRALEVTSCRCVCVCVCAWRKHCQHDRIPSTSASLAGLQPHHAGTLLVQLITVLMPGSHRSADDVDCHLTEGTFTSLISSNLI